MILELKYNLIRDLTKNPYDKTRCVEFSPEKIRTYQSNPALESQEVPAQIVGIADSHVVGGIEPFPIRVFADGKIYRGTSASTYWVEEKYRKTGLGIDLLDSLIDLAPDKIAITCGIAHKARPIYEMMDFEMFCFLRMVLIQKSDWFWTKKTSGFLLKIAVFLTDIALAIYRGCLQLVEFVLNFSMTVEQVTPNNQEHLREVYHILQHDEHRFREEHDEQWFKWVLENNFCGGSHAKQFLHLVYLKHKPIAFYMTKTRQQALGGDSVDGSVIEWGCVADKKRLEPRILLKAILSFGFHAHVIEVETADEKCVSFLKRLGLFQLGVQVMPTKALSESPIQKHEGFADPENWRIRPANGDHGLS